MSWIVCCLILWITNNCPVVLGISSSSSSTGSYSLPSIDSIYYYNSHSYVLYPTPSDWLTINATVFRLGGYITTINDADENSFVYETFIGNLLLSQGISSTVWLGYVRTCSTCSLFYWSDGGTSNYTNWNAGEPNNSDGDESYTAMLAPGGLWNDVPEAGDLGGLNRAVIEFNSIVVNNPFSSGVSSSSSSTGSYSSTEISFSSSSPIGGSSLPSIESIYYYNSHSYVLYPMPSDWSTINATSLRLGGYITTINDADENSFVYDTFVANLLLPRGISNTMWLGLWLGYVRTCSTCSSFDWSNGETSNYTNWAEGEPNNSGGVESYTTMLAPGGVWCDEPETGVLALNWAVIEFDSIILNNPFNSGSCSDGIQILTTANPALDQPSRVALDSNNNVYAADTRNNRIVKLSATGSVIQVFTTTNPGLYYPQGVAVDTSNNMYVADTNNHRMVVFSPNGTQISVWTTIDASLNPFYPQGVAIDPSNNVYVADTFNNRIVKFAPNGTLISVLTTTNPALNSPYGVQLDQSGNIYVADYGNQRIVIFSPDWTLTRVLTTPPLSEPFEVILDNSNNMYVNDYSNHQIVKLAPDGTVIQLLTTSNPSLLPYGVAVDSNYNVYVADGFNSRILIFYSQDCPLGYYCSGLIETAVLCPAGYYCPPQYLCGPSVIACPLGIACPPGTSNLPTLAVGVLCSFEVPSFPASSWAYYGAYLGYPGELSALSSLNGNQTVPNTLTPFSFSYTAGLATAGSTWAASLGSVPDGNQFAFIQESGPLTALLGSSVPLMSSLSVLIIGLEPLTSYDVSFSYALRGYTGDNAPELTLSVIVDNVETIWTRTGFTHSDPWKSVTAGFVAAQDIQQLTFSVSSSSPGTDHTILIDAVFVGILPVPSSTQTCVSLLTPNLTVGTSSFVSLTDPCQLGSFNLSQLEDSAVAPVCRFYPSMFQSPGNLLLNTTDGNSTDLGQTIVACPISSLLRAGTYIIQLSVDGGATFDLPVINSTGILASTLIVVGLGASNSNSSNTNVTTGLNISSIALEHPYDPSVDVLPSGYNLGDTQLITWQAPIGAPAYLSLFLEVTFASWSSTSQLSSPLILSEPCDVIANSLFSNQSRYLWTVPNITGVLTQSFGIDLSYVISVAITGYYTSAMVVIFNNANGGRRLLDLHIIGVVPYIAYTFFALIGGILLPKFLTALIGPTTIAAVELIGYSISQLSYTQLAISLGYLVEGLIAAPGVLVIGGILIVAALAYLYIWGDVHLVTMDGLYYDFQAVGVFWLLLSNPAIYSQYNISGFAMQVQLQPLTYSIAPGSLDALNYRGVTYMAGIAFQADSTCGIITLTPRDTASPRSQTYFDIYDAGVNVNIPYLQPSGSTFASSIAYQLSCATIYLTVPNTAVINTYNGYTLTLTTCAGFDRLCSLTTNLPDYAFNSTTGLVGSWDGDPANDFVDQNGQDWFETYPGGPYIQGAVAGSYGPNDAAGYAFGMTWTVQPNQSFFMSSAPAQIECPIVEDDTDLFIVGCLFGNPSPASNLIAEEVNVTSILENFDPSTLSVPPAIWPNTTFQAIAIAACEAATGIYNLSHVLVQNCLLDVYVVNSTIGAIATGQMVAQMAIQAVELPVLNVTEVSASQALIAVNATSSLSQNGGHCTGIFLSLNGLPVVGPNQTLCVYVVQSRTGASYTSLDVPSNLEQSNLDASVLSLRLGNLTAGTGYNVRMAFLVVTSAGNGNQQTGWTTLSLKTLAPAGNGTSSSSSGSGSTETSGFGASSSTLGSTGTGLFSSSSSTLGFTGTGVFSASSSATPGSIGTSIFGASSSATPGSTGTSVSRVSSSSTGNAASSPPMSSWSSSTGATSGSQVTSSSASSLESSSSGITSSSAVTGSSPAAATSSSLRSSSTGATSSSAVMRSSSTGATSSSAVMRSSSVGIMPSSSSIMTSSTEITSSSSPITSSFSPVIVSSTGITSSSSPIMALSAGVTSSAADATPSSSQSSDPPTGPIVGGVIGGLAAIVLLIILLLCVRKRRNTDKFQSKPTSSPVMTSGDSTVELGTITPSIRDGSPPLSPR